MDLSIIVPVFNEDKTVSAVLERLIALPVDKEIIAVDDASRDGSAAILRRYADAGRIVLLPHAENQGKGAAIVTGLAAARGEYTVIQDADLEYDPDDLLAMLAEARAHDAPVVFGSRVRNDSSGISYRRYYWGGRLLTALANLLYRVNISDESTCYKMVRTDLMKSLGLRCRRFEFCPELVARLGRRKIPIREIPIRYNPRKMDEGKKIRWHDGAEAIWTLLRYRLGAK